MYAGVQARKKYLNTSTSKADLSHIDELEDFLVVGHDCDDDGVIGTADEDLSVVGVDKDDDILFVKVGNSVCNVSIGNEDLAAILNGFPGDAIEFRPFDRYFCRVRILSYWIAVGFLLMTRNVVNDPKVRYELGEGMLQKR